MQSKLMTFTMQPTPQAAEQPSNLDPRSRANAFKQCFRSVGWLVCRIAHLHRRRTNKATERAAPSSCPLSSLHRTGTDRVCLPAAAAANQVNSPGNRTRRLKRANSETIAAGELAQSAAFLLRERPSARHAGVSQLRQTIKQTDAAAPLVGKHRLLAQRKPFVYA